MGDAPGRRVATGRRVYAVKAHVKDLPTYRARQCTGYPYDTDADGFVWLSGGEFFWNTCDSWQKAKLYRSAGAANATAGGHQVFGRPADTFPDGAVPGRYTLVAFDMVAVDETVRTPATRAAS